MHQKGANAKPVDLGSVRIEPDEISREVQTVRRTRAASLQLAELTEGEFEDMKKFVAWIRANRKVT